MRHHTTTGASPSDHHEIQGDPADDVDVEVGFPGGLIVYSDRRLLATWVLSCRLRRKPFRWNTPRGGVDGGQDDCTYAGRLSTHSAERAESAGLGPR